MGSFKVLIPQNVAEEGKAYLREKGHEIKMGSGTTVEAMKSDVQECHAILARTARIPAEVLEVGRNLKVIARHGVGVDNIDVQCATKLGIIVTNTPEANAATVAEHTIGFILALARNLVLCDRALREGDFEIRDRVKGSDVDGKVLGILGLGRIGRWVARKAYYGLSMRIIGYDPFLSREDFPPEVESVNDMDVVLREADFISLHVPSLSDTKGLIGSRELKLMKPTAFLLNLSRGDIVDERELVAALRTGEIAGAGIDVYAEEPPRKNHPLFALDNVLVSPHNAALTSECMVRMALQAAQGIHEVLVGKKPTWPVNNPGNKRRHV